MNRLFVVGVVIGLLPLPTHGAWQAKNRKRRKAPALRMTVMTRTGKLNKYARANQPVFVLINGSDKHKSRLDNRKRNDFERGATDEFKNIPVRLKLDDIKSIRLQVEGNDLWKCEGLRIQFFKEKRKTKLYRLRVNRYFSAGKEKSAFRPIKYMDFKIRPTWED